ncbi:hypothetical protein NV63_06815 [Elizabethkingia anophelis]|nr:hypothetical protein NV63_06815 [Elizabethkingia anophelis]
MENKNKELWGDVLYNAFQGHINEDGWLTSDWAQIIEDNYSDWDKDYNDTGEKRNLYQRMYLIDLEDSEDEKFVRPVQY